MMDPPGTAGAPAGAATWRWLALWCVLLLPLAILFPPMPVDETRYLTAAWEMFNTGRWLVPTVNGVWYSDKSPLLFWLIAGGWKIFGVHTWVARVETLIVALGMLLTLRRLSARLGFDRCGADTAMWLLAGCLGFVVFPVAIMFDLLLALCVLGALRALLDLDARHYKRGIIWLGLTIGFGLLAKGPVMLLHIAGVALLAPLWSVTARAAKMRWYLALFAGLLIGIAILLCWLVPAALYAGPGYWQPLLDKVSGRITNSFAHHRSWWWYLPLLPVLLLPWLLALRAPRVAWRALWHDRVGRFLWCWWLPPFVAFCAISGKQIHYLLPLLPAWMLGGAWLLQRDGARLRGNGLLALLSVLVAAGMCALPWLASREFGYPPQPMIALLALVAVIVAIGVWRVWGHDARSLALASTTLISAALLTLGLALLPALDVRPEAAFVAAAQRNHVPIAFVEPHTGLLGYIGRLREPVPGIDRDRILDWCRAHPDGIVLAAEDVDEPRGVAPFQVWPYILSGNRRIAVWHASSVLAAQKR